MKFDISKHKIFETGEMEHRFSVRVHHTESKDEAVGAMLAKLSTLWEQLRQGDEDAPEKFGPETRSD